MNGAGLRGLAIGMLLGVSMWLAFVGTRAALRAERADWAALREAAAVIALGWLLLILAFRLGL